VTAEEPLFRGTYKGGVGRAGQPTSRQFDIIQNTLKADSAAVFKIYTTRGPDTVTETGELVEGDHNICSRGDVVLGSYDYVHCKAGDDRLEPQALIHDEVSVNYQLSRRKKLSKTGQCELLRVGPGFKPSGVGVAFPKNSLYSNAFSRALQQAMEVGEVRNLIEKYKLQESECSHEVPEGGDIIGLEQISGLFIITVVVTGIAVIHGGFTQIFCPYPKGYEVPEYEEELSEWSDVPDEGLKDRAVAVKNLAYRVERLSGELMEALKTGTPFRYDPDEHEVQAPKERKIEEPVVNGPLSELLNIQLPFGL